MRCTNLPRVVGIRKDQWQINADGAHMLFEAGTAALSSSSRGSGCRQSCLCPTAVPPFLVTQARASLVYYRLLDFEQSIEIIQKCGAVHPRHCAPRLIRPRSAARFWYYPAPALAQDNRHPIPGDAPGVLRKALRDGGPDPRPLRQRGWCADDRLGTEGVAGPQPSLVRLVQRGA